MAKGNPPGKNSKTIGINMSKEIAGELERRASSMQLTTSKYCKTVLIDWISSGKKLKLQED